MGVGEREDKVTSRSTTTRTYREMWTDLSAKQIVPLQETDKELDRGIFFALEISHKTATNAYGSH